MANKYIDISVGLEHGMPVWPESTGIHIGWTKDMKQGDASNLTRLDMDVHVGTHLEGDLHSFKEGVTVDNIPLEILIGKIWVADFLDTHSISADDLARTHIPDTTTRVLFHTKNSLLWKNKEKNFYKDFVGLTASGAQWLVDRNMCLVGNDYLSVARYEEGAEVHEILLKNGIVILEGVDLTDVSAGEYELICLPLKLIGREAAPARAVLLPLSQ